MMKMSFDKQLPMAEKIIQSVEESGNGTAVTETSDDTDTNTNTITETSDDTDTNTNTITETSNDTTQIQIQELVNSNQFSRDK